ncbi:MAG TPA: hypothetical protein VGG62_10665 [Terracidiphilus sp.]|jgi:hypothetical protein
MNISEAMRAVSEEFDDEVTRAREDRAFSALMCEAIGAEYDEIDQELSAYVIDIVRAHGVPVGTVLPTYVYQLARMVFRMGMRVQRKLDRPSEASSIFWRSDQTAV